MDVKRVGTLCVALSVVSASMAFSQHAPTDKDQIAMPGGQLPGNPEIALVKLAEGFEDPINVTNAGDGSGRIFVVERAGRVRIMNADGSINDELFLDLTNLLPTSIILLAM